MVGPRGQGLPTTDEEIAGRSASSPQAVRPRLDLSIPTPAHGSPSGAGKGQTGEKDRRAAWLRFGISLAPCCFCVGHGHGSWRALEVPQIPSQAAQSRPLLEWKSRRSVNSIPDTSRVDQETLRSGCVPTPNGIKPSSKAPAAGLPLCDGAFPCCVMGGKEGEESPGQAWAHLVVAVSAIHAVSTCLQC